MESVKNKVDNEAWTKVYIQTKLKGSPQIRGKIWEQFRRLPWYSPKQQVRNQLVEEFQNEADQN